MSWDAMLRDEEARARCCAPPASGEACVDCPEVTDDMVERAWRAGAAVYGDEESPGGRDLRATRAALVAALTPTHEPDGREQS